MREKFKGEINEISTKEKKKEKKGECSRLTLILGLFIECTEHAHANFLFNYRLYFRVLYRM